MMNQLYYLGSTLRTLTFKRFINLIHSKITYYLSQILRRPISRGMPYFTSIEPTTSCNLQCPECPSGLRKFTRDRGFISKTTLEKILQEMGDYLIYLTFYFQGEPLMHRDFPELVKMVKRKNILIGTSTNAHFLDAKKGKEIIESGLDRLIISLDGTDAETYTSYRKGGDFEKVMTNLKGFLALKKEMKSRHPLVELQFIVFKHNEHQIEEIKKLAKTLKVDKLSLKTAQLYEFEQGNALMPGKMKYSRYEEYEKGKYRIKGGLPNRCARSWSGSVITWDGGLVPCCFDKDADHRFGNIHNQNYKEIMNSEAYKNFIGQILKDRSQHEICRNCSEGL